MARRKATVNMKDVAALAWVSIGAVADAFEPVRYEPTTVAPAAGHR